MEENRVAKKNLETTTPSKALSQKKKVLLTFIFVLGIPLSYPTVMPLGIICASILLFQKNKKANLMGLFLILVQFISIIIFVGLNVLSRSV